MVSAPIGGYVVGGGAVLQITRGNVALPAIFAVAGWRGFGLTVRKRHGRPRPAWIIIGAGIVAAWMVCDAPLARAQDDNRTTTVTGRSRAELDPLGVRAGGFLIFPSATITESFDDNIFSSDTGAVDDLITNIEPKLLVNSDWQSHELAIFGNADVALHVDRSAEDYEDFVFGGKGRLDILRDFSATAGLVYSDLHESRGSPDDVDGNEPTNYSELVATVGIAAKRNRISLSAEGTLTSLDFDDATDATGVIDNDDRDRDRHDLVLYAGYEMTPEYEAFVRASVEVTDYTDAVDSEGINRDSDGIEIVAGARIDVTGVVFGDVFAGYISPRLIHQTRSIRSRCT
jgi:hypothetical protein